MTTLISTNNRVGLKKREDKEQIYLANQKFLATANLDIGVKFDICHVNDQTVEFIPHSQENANVVATLTVSKKGMKRIIDVVGHLPEAFTVGAKLRIVAISGKLIVTLHDEAFAIEDREQDIVSRLDDGKEVKVATMFAGSNMRDMLKRNGLVRLSNDISCRLAIEIEAESFHKAQARNPEYWQKPNSAALGPVQDIDFSKVSLPRVNGLMIDASHFDFKVDKKAGRARSLSSNDDCDPQGVQLLTVVEVIKRTNPAFISIELCKKVFSDKKTQEEYSKGASVLMTIFSSVINSLGYNIEQNVVESDEGREYVELLAISNGLDVDAITNSSVVSCTGSDLKAVQPELIEPVNFVEKQIQLRETTLSSRIRDGLPLLMGSAFSGGGILDRSLHEGFADFGIESYCKYGMEWVEEYFDSNLSNNTDVWRDDSFFLLGDVRTVNVYRRPLPQISGLAMGVPCIGASVAGLVKNSISCAEEHEVAGALFISSLEIMKSSNSAFLTLENVPEYQSTVSMVVIRSVLHYLGYDLKEDVFAGNEYGALENRRRLVLIATSKGLNGTSVIDNMRPLKYKESTLGAVAEQLPLDHESWTWRDYLDAKAINDKANGNCFDQQILRGTESKCGTIGKSYQKARSTEPFLRHPLCDLFAHYVERLDGGDEPASVACRLINSEAVLGLYVNTANTAIRRFNLRNKLKGDDRLESKFSAIAAGGMKELHTLIQSIGDDDVVAQEFIDATIAISKSTRLFNPNEHAALKAVPNFMIEGLSATRAHEILGNGVVFTLFRSVGRSVAQFILTSIFGKHCVELVDVGTDCLNDDLEDVQQFWYNSSEDDFSQNKMNDDDESYRVKLIKNTQSMFHVCLNDMPSNIAQKLDPDFEQVYVKKRLLAA